MARIVLINPPYRFWGEGFDDLKRKTDASPSLGLLSLAAQGLKAGHSVRLVDLALHPRTPDRAIAEIRAFAPTLVGISAVTVNVAQAADLARRIRQALPGVPVVLGGPHGTALPEETLARHPVFDALALREGEDTFLELAEAADGGRALADVAGLALPGEGGVRFTAERPLIRDLDRLAFPAWELLAGFPKGYSAPIFNFKRLPAATLISSRGCPLTCRFCDRSGLGHRIRFHSAEYVLGMADRLVKGFGVRHLIFYDDMFVANRRRLAAICEGLARLGPRVSFSCNGRVGFMSREILSRLKRAGCWQIAYGIESGDQGILDRIGKGQRLEEIERDVAWTREAGIRVKGLFMLGLPGETPETIERTARFARSLDLDLFQTTKFTPLPGCDFFATAEEYGTFDRDWSRMNMMQFVFVPRGFTEEELERRFWEVNRSFYARGRTAFKLARFFLGHPAQLEVGLKAGLEFFGRTLRRRHGVARRS